MVLQNSQKGISLIITFFIMVIILAVVFSISALLFSEVKVLRNIGNSVVAFFAADSGVEKVLFYDSQVLPVTEIDDGGNIIYGKRGLCSMVPYDPATNPTACQPSGDSAEQSIYCNPAENLPEKEALDLPGQTGCDPDKCDNCQISFRTDFSADPADKNYSVIASVVPSSGGESTDFEIRSKGVYRTAERQIRVITKSAQVSAGAIKITNACANPKSSGQGTDITISAHVESTIAGGTVISTVVATVKDTPLGGPVSGGTFDLTCQDSPCTPSSDWANTWSTTTVGDYYVDITATDSEDPAAVTTLQNILPCGF